MKLICSRSFVYDMQTGHKFGTSYGLIRHISLFQENFLTPLLSWFFKDSSILIYRKSTHLERHICIRKKHYSMIIFSTPFLDGVDIVKVVRLWLAETQEICGMSYSYRQTSLFHEYLLALLHLESHIGIDKHHKSMIIFEHCYFVNFVKVVRLLHADRPQICNDM